MKTKWIDIWNSLTNEEFNIKVFLFNYERYFKEKDKIGHILSSKAA